MRSFVLAVAAASFVATPLHSQFGIGKKIKSAAASAAGVPGASAGSGVQTGRMTFNDEVLEMTSERLGQFIKGLEAESQVLARMESTDQERARKQNEAAEAAWSKQSDDYMKKDAAWERCAEPEQRRGEADLKTATATAPDEAAMNRIAERIKAAQARGDMAEVRRLADSVGRTSMAVSNRATGVANEANARIEQKCGKRPVEPARPTLTQLVSASDIREAGLKASGLTDRQYSIMRERVLPYVASKGKSSGGMVYTKDEADALAANLEALSTYSKLLQQY